MTTNAIVEIIHGNEKVIVYGRHDGYPGNWPKTVINAVVHRGNMPIVDAVENIVKSLRQQDYELYLSMEIFRKKYGNEAVRIARKLANENYRIIKPSEIPEIWVYYYIIDLDKGKVTIRDITSNEIELTISEYFRKYMD